MPEFKRIVSSRMPIAIRLLYTVGAMIALELLKLTLQVAVLFQYVHLLLTRETNEPVRAFSNKLCTYGYRLMRYASLAENARPFPFGDFPSERDPIEDPVEF